MIMNMNIDSKKEISNIISETNFIPWDDLKGKNVFITGATGLIGTAVIKVLHSANVDENLGINLFALVRDKKSAVKKFNEIVPGNDINVVSGSVECIPDLDFNIDYIIHGASQTASMQFVSHAVETIQTSVVGTLNMLNLAKEKKVKGFAYLSSMEVYGYPKRGQKVTEEDIGSLTPFNLRNSYPISKLMSEAMCCAFANEYGVPATICRLTQVIGDEIDNNDNRVAAYLRRCLREGNDIILKTKGESERCYISNIDAATAILTVMLKGEPGCAYNIADEESYCSIADLANRVAEQGGIKVEYRIEDESQNGFPKTLYMDLDTTALKKLGWIKIKNII